MTEEDKTPRGVAFFMKEVCDICTNTTSCNESISNCIKVEEMLILRDIKQIILGKF